ncbi:hypothetical protein [Lysobacter sp. H23M47]|uniref:hypothetical protein n=1 Tax=Lysobacter sp. H23M47 TaxID=2781024 RepID=UPI0018823A7A|nr:hypothetical protein [Lysobacter sp. H23M47]QOW24656.1 hypothetical protein INQ43_00690 [Lysobacter sp. H23M47]
MSIPLKAKLFAALFGLGFAGFGWAILFYSDWFIPSRFVSWFAVGVSVALAYWVMRASPMAALEKRRLVKLGVVAMLSLWSWLFFAQTVPALFTRFAGSTHQATVHASEHYRSTRTCRYRLVLREFNPPFGGFCRAGLDGHRLKPGEPVLVTYEQSLLGRFILRFDRAR